MILAVLLNVSQGLQPSPNYFCGHNILEHCELLPRKGEDILSHQHVPREWGKRDEHKWLEIQTQ